MAEATLNDVSNAIQQGNQKAESQQKFSEFNEYRRNKSSGKVLNSLMTLEEDILISLLRMNSSNLAIIKGNLKRNKRH